MKQLLASAMFFVSLPGCMNMAGFDWKITPPPDQDSLNEKARSEFLQRPVVKEFIAAGIAVDCELSICGKVSEANLQTLQLYKAQFLKKSDRIKSVTLVKEDYPIFDYRLEGAYIPAQLSGSLMDEFFEVLDTLREFENQIGVRVEFPNSAYFKASINPLLQILKDNQASLTAEKHRYELLIVSSVYNRFYPQEKALKLKIADLKTSFADLWSFMSRLFKAQDLFGSVRFSLDYGDAQGLSTLELLLQSSGEFAPLLSKLQSRSIAFFPWEYYAYGDGHGHLIDLWLSSSFDKKYLTEVFQDQIRVIELSQFIGKRISHRDSLIDLNGHSECLEKLEQIKSDIKAKIKSIADITVASGPYAPEQVSVFSGGLLFLNCRQTAAEMALVINSIESGASGR